MFRPAVAALLLTAAAVAAQDPPPTAADPRLVVELFAAAPDIVHPIATDFDAKGRLLVVESHTHFRPANYTGPKFDRIQVLEDTNGDGKADKFTTFFEGTTATMDVAAHFDGSVYVATRNEILRLRDTDGDGVADEKTRVVFLDTAGNYPHNGLSGLTFDTRGGLVFGMGENLGAAYKLVGSDGVTISGQGDGGHVFRCAADGKKLRRIATGFWNPFGACFDIHGRLFVVDNDPDSSPPCRLLHVVEGGDYGFQFRYGRSGRHPFQAWNGELPGTLPYSAGTGESPCEVIAYESDGLPAEYRGSLLVPAWADHRLERYVPRVKGATVVADREPFVKGGSEFRPSGLAVAPDGSLFVSDWVSRSYNLHGKGAVWHVRWKDAPKRERPADPKAALASPHRKTREAAARTLANDPTERHILRAVAMTPSGDVRPRAAALAALIDANDQRLDLNAIARSDADVGLREMAVRGIVARGDDVSAFVADTNPASVRAEAVAGVVSEQVVSKMLTDPDPFLRHAAVQRMAARFFLRDRIRDGAKGKFANPRVRLGVLLAYLAAGDSTLRQVVEVYLHDPDPDVRFLATKVVADERLTRFRSDIADAMKRPDLDPRAAVGLATALARLDDKPVNEDGLATYFLDRLADPTARPETRIVALKAVPAASKKLSTQQLTDWLKDSDPAFRVEVLRALRDRADAKAASPVKMVAVDTKQPAAVRAQAVVTLAALIPTDAEFFLGLAAEPDPVVRTEALRALVGAPLSDTQQARLDALSAKGDSRSLLARLQGKSAAATRPPATDTDAWLARLDGRADPDAGRRVFESATVASCSRCHRVDGRGATVGPDLSLIGRTERRWVVESILQPSAVIAPHFQAWRVETTDGRVRTGLLAHTYLDESTYVDEKGDRFKVLAGDVAESTPAKSSVMPEKLLDSLTDQEIRDLIAFLMSRK